MSEYLPEAIKVFKEYLDWAKAPQEFAATVQALGGQNEEVIYKGYARFLSTGSMFDKPKGVIVITTARLAFLTKKKVLPFAKGTEHVVLRLGALTEVESIKYRLGNAIKVVSEGKEYLFLLSNLNSFADAEQHRHVATLINDARANVA